MIVKQPRSCACSWCGGHGLVMNGEDVAECSKCWGAGWEEARDARGRFLPWERVEVPDDDPSLEAQMRDMEENQIPEAER